MNTPDRWPIDRSPEEMLAVVRRRAHLRRAQHVGGVAAASVLVAGVIAAATLAPSHSTVRTIDGPNRPTTTVAPAPTRPAASGSPIGAPAAGPTAAPVTTPSTTSPAAAASPAPVALTGIDASTIHLGNVSTLTGVGSQVGSSALAGARAVVAYQNSVGGMWGRTIVLDSHDDLGLAPRNHDETQAAVAADYALLGSASYQDDAGSAVLGAVPDASNAYGPQRRAATTNFSVAPNAPDEAATSKFLALRDVNAAATAAVGTLYFTDDTDHRLQAAAMAAATSAGWKVGYSQAVQPTQSDFTAEVIQMQSKGVRTVYLGAVSAPTAQQFVSSMKSHHFQPDLVVTEGPATLDASNAQGEGVFVPAIVSPTGSEVDLFRTWLARVAPGAAPDVTAAEAWAEGRLLFTAMARSGAPVTRDALVVSLRSVTGFDSFGLLAPVTPSSKAPSACSVLTQNRGGSRVRVSPASGFRCDGGLARG